MNAIALKVAVLCCCSSLFAACGTPEANLSFASKGQALTRASVDESTAIRVDGLAPGTLVTLKASLADGSSSWATYAANGEGRIDTSVSEAVNGTYRGVDADGLFWSMRATEPSLVTKGSLDVTVVAVISGTVVAEAKLDRFVSMNGLTSGIERAEEDPCGTLIPRPPRGVDGVAAGL